MGFVKAHFEELASIPNAAYSTLIQPWAIEKDSIITGTTTPSTNTSPTRIFNLMRNNPNFNFIKISDKCKFCIQGGYNICTHNYAMSLTTNKNLMIQDEFLQMLPESEKAKFLTEMEGREMTIGGNYFTKNCIDKFLKSSTEIDKNRLKFLILTCDPTGGSEENGDPMGIMITAYCCGDLENLESYHVKKIILIIVYLFIYLFIYKLKYLIVNSFMNFNILSSAVLSKIFLFSLNSPLFFVL